MFKVYTKYLLYHFIKKIKSLDKFFISYNSNSISIWTQTRQILVKVNFFTCNQDSKEIFFPFFLVSDSIKACFSVFNKVCVFKLCCCRL